MTLIMQINCPIPIIFDFLVNLQLSTSLKIANRLWSNIINSLSPNDREKHIKGY